MRRIKRVSLVLSFVVVLSIILSLSISTLWPRMDVIQAQSTTTFFVDPPSKVDPALTPGTDFTVDVKVSDAYYLYSWQVYMTWDDTVIGTTSDDVVIGDFLADQPEGSTPIKTVAAGYLIAADGTAGKYPGKDGDGLLVTITFSVKATGETTLNISHPTLTYYNEVFTPPTQTKITDFPKTNGYFSNAAVTHTLTVDSDPVSGIDFTVDGTAHTTSWSDSLSEGSHTIVMPSTWDIYNFDHWEDASTDPTRIIMLTSDIDITAYYILAPVFETVVTIDPQLNTGEPDQYFTVNVTIADVADLVNWNARISWSAGLLSTDEINVTEGPFLKPGGSTSFTKKVSIGYLDIANMLIGAVPGVTGDGTLATIIFKVLDSGNCTLKLDATRTTLYNSTYSVIDRMLQDGYFYTKQPVAQFAYTPHPTDYPGHPLVNEPVTFNATESYDPDDPYDSTPGGIVSYMWDFGDGNVTTVSSPIITHVYDESGSFIVVLSVTDDDGESHSVDHPVLGATINVQLHDIVVINVTVTPAEVSPGGEFTINITVLNQGSETETLNVTVYANMQPVATQLFEYDTIGPPPYFPPQHHTSLEVGENGTTTVTWDTTGVPVGSYAISVKAFLVKMIEDKWQSTPELETLMEDNTLVDGTVTVIAAEIHDVAVTSVTAPAEAVQGDTMTISVDVSNSGAYDETFDVNVTYDTTLIGTQSVTLASGDSTTLTFDWDTTGVSLGTYTITGDAVLTTDEDPTNNIATTAIEIIVSGQTIDHPVEIGGVTFHVATESNSTVSDFTFNQTQMQISFNVTGPEDTEGFCKVTIPKDLLGGTFTVLINGASLPYELTENATHYFIYLTYSHSTQAIQIIGTTVATPPIAAFTYSPSEPVVGETVTFDASESYDPDGTIASYSWDFGDGTTTTETEPTVTHAYAAAGTYTVSLTVTDNAGLSDTATDDVTVSAAAPESPVASFTFSPLSPAVGDTVTFDASGSSDPDGAIVSWDWDFGDGASDSGEVVTHAYAAAGTYTVTLTVTDDDALTDTATHDITVTTAAVLTATVNIDPDTLNLKSKGRWITCYITLPEGYKVSDIDVSTILLDGVIPAEWGKTEDNVLMVKFDRAEVIQYIKDELGITKGQVTLTVTGKLMDGTSFEGHDTIRVISKGGLRMSLHNWT